MEKLCTRCNLVLDQSEFNWKIKGRQLAAYCKQCSRAYVKSHYDRNKSYYIKKARKRNQIIRYKLREYVGKYLSSHPCVDCGETDILVLEFDHKDRNNKLKEVSLIIRGMLSLKTLTNEMGKCEVRCANCHRRKTNKENNSWKMKYAPIV